MGTDLNVCGCMSVYWDHSHLFEIRRCQLLNEGPLLVVEQGMQWHTLCTRTRFHTMQIYLPEPGIRRGNEDSRRNENWKSRGKSIFCGEKIGQGYFFLWKLRWWICECKSKVQNWHSSWTLMCYITQICPQNASNCTDFNLDFQNFPRGMPLDPPDISSFFISNSSLWSASVT